MNIKQTTKPLKLKIFDHTETLNSPLPIYNKLASLEF